MRIRLFQAKVEQAIAEISLVDMNNNDKVLGESVFAYVSMNNEVSRGRVLNVYIPTCFVDTYRKTDGCIKQSKNDLSNVVDKAFKMLLE